MSCCNSYFSVHAGAFLYLRCASEANVGYSEEADTSLHLLGTEWGHCWSGANPDLASLL